MKLSTRILRYVNVSEYVALDSNPGVIFTKGISERSVKKWLKYKGFYVLIN